MVFEVDPSLPSPDDLQTDADADAAAREQYARDKTGRLTILPCSICYLPLAHFASSETLDCLHTKADNLAGLNRQKRAIQKQRLDGHTTLGQVEYIFDLGNWNPYFQGENGKKYGTMLQILQYPFSVGSIHVRPGKGGKHGTGADKPSINPEYYRGDHGSLDVAVMMECARFVDKIVQTEPLSSIIQSCASPSAASTTDENNMREWIVRNTITDWHPVATCSMGGHAGVQGGVVDERLRVYGVGRLRVVDASVMPLQISAHLQATVYAIGEKGAHMILQDVALSGVA